jgi:DNA-directed RNA polymerase subunit RPC12/RpoP
MADIFEYKCPHCGASVEFDSATQNMKCPYCDSEFDVEALKNMDSRLDVQKPDEFNWDNEHRDEWDESEQAQMSVYICHSCGAEIVSDENTAATECIYCGNPVVLSGRLSGALKPDYVIPFKLDKKAAKDTLKAYIAKKKFAPGTFKSENKLEEIKGMYVPFWLFDSDSEAAVSYDATKVRSWTSGDYKYTETSHYDVFREGTMSFENIPVDGSTKMADELMESIEPFNFSEAVDFQTAYLSGYFADKYDVSMEESIDRANERIRQSCIDTLRSTVSGYDGVTVKNSSVQQMNGRSKYALYPVWLLNTSYKGEKFVFAMNGQTGRLVGDLPVSKAKLAGLAGGLVAGLTPILYFVCRIFFG